MMLASRRTGRWLGIVAATIAVVPLNSQPAAHAEELEVEEVITEVATATNILNSLLAGTNAVEQQAIDEFVASQADAGRLVDAALVNAAEVAGGVITWESGIVVESVESVQTLFTDEESAVQQITLETYEGPDLIQSLQEETAILTNEDTDGDGAGLGPASYSGGTRLANNCATYTHRNTGNKVIGCVQKFKPRNDHSRTRDYYQYNRYGSAVAKEVNNGFDYRVDYWALGSRPRDGMENLTKGMSNYFPYGQEQLCNEGGSVSLSTGSLSLSVPLGGCSNRIPRPDTGAKKMILINDPSLRSGIKTAGADYTQEVYTDQGRRAPNLGYLQGATFCSGAMGYYSCGEFTGENGW